MSTTTTRWLARFGALAATVAFVGLGLLSSPAHAATDPGLEAEFVVLTNQERVAEGSGALRVTSDLTRVARQHSARMADGSNLHHNPDLTSHVSNWRIVGENVGRGPSVASLHRALMNSPGHRRNILDDRFTEIGIGVEVRGSTVWVTQVFRTPSAASTAPSATTAGAVAVAGDFNGDGTTTPGFFLDGTWHLSNHLARGTELIIDFGRRGDIPVVGDFNGDGRDTIGIVRGGSWMLRNTLTGGSPHITFTFGNTDRGDHPIVGDWNGTGTDGIGIIRDREWHLRNRLSSGPADRTFIYGQLTRGDIALVGDWNRDGRDTIGIVRDGEWHLRNDLRGGNAHHMFVYGRVLAGDVPIIGDWNRTGTSGVGIVRNGEWYLRNQLSGGNAQLQFRL